MLHVIRNNIPFPQIDLCFSASSAHEEVEQQVMRQEKLLVPVENSEGDNYWQE